MKLDKEKFGFCCLGVKANERDEFAEITEDNLNRLAEGNILDAEGVWFETEYLDVIDTDSQSFLGHLNDETELDFDQIASIIEHMANHPEQATATVKWLHDMDKPELTQWLSALRNGGYHHQCKSQLAKEID